MNADAHIIIAIAYFVGGIWALRPAALEGDAWWVVVILCGLGFLTNLTGALA